MCSDKGFIPTFEGIGQAISYENDLQTLRQFKQLGYELKVDPDGKVSSWSARAEVQRVERLIKGGNRQMSDKPKTKSGQQK